MPSRPDLRELASHVKDAFADADRETLLDVLTFVIKEYVVEGPPPMLIHQAETLSDLRAPTFAQLIAALQNRFAHPALPLFAVARRRGGPPARPSAQLPAAPQNRFDPPELAMFAVDGDQVSVRIGNAVHPLL